MKSIITILFITLLISCAQKPNDIKVIKASISKETTMRLISESNGCKLYLVTWHKDSFSSREIYWSVCDDVNSNSSLSK